MEIESLAHSTFAAHRRVQRGRIIPGCAAGLTTYRDALKLFLVFASKRQGRPPSQLTLVDLDRSVVLDFLDHLEKSKGAWPRASLSVSSIDKHRTRIRRTSASITIGPLERSLSLAEKNPGNARVLADAGFTLARALSDPHREQKRARQLALLARAAFAADGEASKRELAQVDVVWPCRLDPLKTNRNNTATENKTL